MKTTKLPLSQLISVCLLLLFCSANVQAQDPEPIGLMLSTVGVVTAEDLDGNVRRLQRRSPVFEGDTLITANRARAQVRFNDRGLIALQPNTSFFIEEHNFEGQEDGTESAIYSLLRGGLQAITGLIGHSNRDRYQVSTPIATIGLRGTHWAATFCTTACDGNAPGLYGGVADGGIDVCNGAGCTAVETNSYFYTPDANTLPTRLLAPPSVVFAAVEEDEEPEEGAEEIAETTTEEGETATEDTVTDVAAFVERSVTDAGTTLAAVVEDVRTTTELEDDSVVERTEEIVREVIEEEVDAVTPTTAAPFGSIVALASARGVSADNTQTAGLNILVAPTGTTTVPRAAFVDAPTETITDTVTGETTVVSTTTALAALDFDLEDGGCDPCLYATAGLDGTSATLSEYIETTVDGVDVFLGRWSGDALLLNSGVNLNALQDHHYAIALTDQGFAFSPAIPSVDVVDENAIGVFDLLEATAPTDANSVAGTLNRAQLVMDFYQQIVTNMELDISFEDEREIFASLVSPFQFAEGTVAGLFAPLGGYCMGGSCGQITDVSGDTSLSFIGSSSEHILGAYSLDTEAFDQSVFGTYLLGLDFTFDPLIVANPASAPATDGFLLFSGTENVAGLYLPLLSDFIEAGGSNNIQLASVYDTTNVLAGFSYTNSDGCDPCLFDVAGGRLDERGSVSLLGAEFFYGTWSLTDFDVSETGESLALTDVVSYLYSPTDIQLQSAILSSSSPSLVSFSYLGGPSPSDETGALGVINSIDLGLDLYYQTVERFDIEVEIAARLYEAGMIGIADLAAVLSGSELALSGNCTGGLCLSGELLTGSANLGVAAVSSSGGEAGLVGSFALQTLDATAGSVGIDGVSAVITEVPSEFAATGLFVLEQNEVEDHPDYVSEPSFVVTDGVAAVSVTGTLDGEFAPVGATQDSDHANIGLTTVDMAENVLVSFEDTDIEIEEEGGSFAVLEAVLEDYSETDGFIVANNIVDEAGVLSTSDDFYVNLGRWNLLNGALFIDDAPYDTTADAHFAYSDSPTDLDSFLETNPFDLSAPLLKYTLVDATAPSDEAGNLGELLSANLELDLYQQLVSDFSLSLDVGDREIDAWLYEAVALGESEIKILGECYAGDCGDGLGLLGDFSFALLGAEAEGAIGNYNLFANYGEFPVDSEILVSDITANGVFALGRDDLIENPYWFDGNDPVSSAPLGSGFAGAGLVAEDGFLQAQQIGLIEDESSSFTLLDEFAVPFSYSDQSDDELETFSVSDAGALLLDKDYHFYGDDVVLWGRWLSYEGFDFALDEEMLDTGANAHFIWSDALTDPELEIEIDSTIAHYEYAGGSSPTDEMGRTGQVNFLAMDLDLFQQAIFNFGMQIAIEDRVYSAGMLRRDSTYYLEELTAEFDLVGICVGGLDCGEGVKLEGETSLLFVGDSTATETFDQMSGVMGSYALQTAGEEPDLSYVKDLLFFENYETDLGVGEADIVNATGTYFLQGETFENPRYFDIEDPAAVVAPTSIGVAAVVTGSFDYYGYSGGIRGESSFLGGIDDDDAPADDVIYLTSLDGVDNIVTGFDSFSADMYSEYLEKFSVLEGVLAEQGGFSAFLADNGFASTEDFGINWGRWSAYATYLEGEYDGLLGDFVSTPSEEMLGMDHHFIYTDAESGILPSFDDPTEAVYHYVGGPSPTDEWGRTGWMDAQMHLDLYTQTLSDFEMTVAIGDRFYFAQYDREYDEQLGMDLQDLLEDSIDLRGACVGGDCDAFYDEYSYYGYGWQQATPLRGEASFMPFGPSGEGFLGTFDLGFEYYCECYVPDEIENIRAYGAFVLAQDTRDHIGWFQRGIDPDGTDAESGSVAVLSGTLTGIDEGDNSVFDSFAAVADLSDGDAFTTIAIEDHAHIVDSFVSNIIDDEGCYLCEFEAQDAVVIALGDVSHPYQYLDNPVETSWATWANRELPVNEWLFGDSGVPLDSMRVANTIYANNLTSAAELASAAPLTGFLDSDPTEIIVDYYYAGGPAAVYSNGAADIGDQLYLASVEYINLQVDFLDQELDSFSADIYLEYEDTYGDIELDFDDYEGPVDLAPTMRIGLYGNCDNCGSSSYDFEYFEGYAELAFVGDNAEQVIGGLAAWSDGSYYYGSMIPNHYAVEASFILNQEFDDHWVDGPATESAPEGGVVSFAATDWDTTSALVFGFGLDENNTAELTNVFAQTHNHPNSVAGFSVTDSELPNCGASCSWEVTEGELYTYDNTNNPYSSFLPEAYWGRWETHDSIEIDGVMTELTEFQHWAYSPDPTDLSMDNPIWGAGAAVHSYSFTDGTYATDLYGNQAYYLDDFQMSVNFETQMVEEFEFDVNLGGWQFSPVLAEAAHLSEANLDLIGSVWDGSTNYDLSGNSSIYMIGAGAEGAIGAYGIHALDMSTSDIMNTATGAFMAQDDSLYYP
jgi:hypothetical protein